MDNWLVFKLVVTEWVALETKLVATKLHGVSVEGQGKGCYSSSC